MPHWILLAAVVLAQLVASRGARDGAIHQLETPAATPSLSLASLVITPPAHVVAVGDVAYFQAVATFSDGTIADVTNTLTWTVAPLSDAMIANGEVRGLTPGILTISATSGAFSATAILLVQ